MLQQCLMVSEIFLIEIAHHLIHSSTFLFKSLSSLSSECTFSIVKYTVFVSDSSLRTRLCNSATKPSKTLRLFKNKNITTKVICSITFAIVAAIAANIGVGTGVIVATGTIVFCIVVLAWLLITQYNKSEKTFKGLCNDMDELVTKMNNLGPNMVAIERRLTLISDDLDIVGHERNSSEQAGNKKNCPNKKDCLKPKYWPLGTLWNGVKHYVLKVVSKLPHRSTPNNVTNVKEEKSTFEYDRFCQILDTLLDGIRKCDHELELTVTRWSTTINVQDM